MTQAHSFARSSLRRLLVSAFALSSAWCTVTAFGSSTVTISGSPSHTATAGLPYSFTPTTNDTARRALRFTIVNKPAWASFNSGTGSLTGTPSASNVGTQPDIVIRVSDGVAVAELPYFRIQVYPAPGSSPVVSGSPPTSAVVGQAYAFIPTVSNASGQTLRYSLVNKPAWATFDTGTGKLWGTPTASNVGTQADILLTVTDANGSSRLPEFSIHVLASGGGGASAPLTISGAPTTSVVEGHSYSFKPSASGPSGKTLSFSVHNLPSWATFSIASGRLSGTPSSTQTGTYGNIIISVSDGQASSALAPFSISVTGAAATRQVIVDWSPPTQNTNGTALTNLAGVRVYYGPSASNLSQLTQVAGTAVKSYTISNLSAGTWYFGAVAYSTTGADSAMSSIVSTTIQ